MYKTNGIFGGWRRVGRSPTRPVLEHGPKRSQLGFFSACKNENNVSASLRYSETENVFALENFKSK